MFVNNRPLQKHERIGKEYGCFENFCLLEKLRCSNERSTKFETGRGILPEKVSGGVRPASQNP